MQRTPSSSSSLSRAVPYWRAFESSRSSVANWVMLLWVWPGQAGAVGVGTHPLGFVCRQEQFADRGEMQRGARADGSHHLHARTLAVGALDVDDLVALAHAEIDRLLDVAVQFAHGLDSRVAYVEPGLDEIAEFQKPHAQTIASGFGTVDKPADGQIVEDTMSGGRVQACLFADLLEGDGLLAVGKHIDQRKHALDHLDGGRGGQWPVGFFHCEGSERKSPNFIL